VRKRRAAAIALMASTLYAVGCSLFVDASGLAGDPLVDASTIDAAGDRPTTESGLDTSAPADAGKICDATFCDDFEDGPLGARWTSVEITNGGIAELTMPDDAGSKAFRARFSGGSASGDRSAVLERDLGKGSHLRCDFSMFVAARPNEIFVDALRIRTTVPGVDPYHLLFGVNAGAGGTFREDFFYTEGGCDCPLHDGNPPTFPDSQWVRVTFETNFMTASIAYDGQVVSAGKFFGFTPATNVFVALGSIAYKPETSDMRFDDFSCTMTP
jgi:hypothetical protein